MSPFRERAKHPARRIVLAAALILASEGCSYHPGVCGLRPHYPDVTAETVGDALVFPETDSLRPTLRWETFPRPSDLRADRTGLLARARDVTYEIRIRRADDNVSIRPVYIRKGIPAAHHRVEIRLEPDSRYYWSVRAAFRVGEETRVIPWGFSKVPPVPGLESCILPGNIPEANLYRFRTPPSPQDPPMEGRSRE